LIYIHIIITIIISGDNSIVYFITFIVIIILI